MCFLTGNPYNGQVYLENYNSYINSSGEPYLHFNDQWLPVCVAEPFNQYIADTVCHQLGYTGAIENGFQYKYLKYKCIPKTILIYTQGKITLMEYWEY